MAGSSDRLNLLDVAKRIDPNGAVAQIVEVLHETNAILQDAPAQVGNAPLGNRVTLRSSLPTVSLAKINKGSVKSKGSTEQRTDTIGMFDARSEVDVKMKVGMGAAAFAQHRKNEDDGFLEALSQKFAETILYGDERAEEAAFTGLALRLNALGIPLSGSKVVSAGGAGADNTSIFLVDWHPRYVHLIYPEGMSAGIETKDLGEIPSSDKDGNPMQVFASTYLWAIGLTVKDPRHLGRLANIDVSDAATAGQKTGDTSPEIILKLIDIVSEMPDPMGAQRVLYAHNRLAAAFHKQALSKANLALSIQDYLGKPIVHFQGYPIRRMDRASLAESLVP